MSSVNVRLWPRKLFLSCKCCIMLIVLMLMLMLYRTGMLWTIGPLDKHGRVRQLVEWCALYYVESSSSASSSSNNNSKYYNTKTWRSSPYHIICITRCSHLWYIVLTLRVRIFFLLCIVLWYDRARVISSKSPGISERTVSRRASRPAWLLSWTSACSFVLFCFVRPSGWKTPFFLFLIPRRSKQASKRACSSGAVPPLTGDDFFSLLSVSFSLSVVNLVHRLVLVYFIFSSAGT